MSSGFHDDVGSSATTPLVFRPTLHMQSWTFIIGASLFALGSAPGLGTWLGTGANTAFFVGAWFFTAAGFIQLLLSTPRIGPRGGVRAEWLAAAAQSFGTVLFNVSTGAALHTRQLSAERIRLGAQRRGLAGPIPARSSARCASWLHLRSMWSVHGR